MRIILSLITVVIIILALVLVIDLTDSHDTGPYRDFVDMAHPKQVIAQCKTVQLFACGVTLSDCTSGHKYRCLTNVVEK